jgi:putative ABC transport system ATP-binding protein
MLLLNEEYAMTRFLLKCQDVTKTFHTRQKRLEILKGVNFSARQGETILVFGKSGQGKSVLLSLLCGLDFPTAGEIWFDSTSLRSCSPRQMSEFRRTKIGIVFQSLNLIQSWTARARRRQAAELLETIGLAERFDHLPSEMSLGEQQRIAIARTLIRKPTLVLADEPTGDLDDGTARDIVHLMRSYVQERKATLVIASHGHFPPEYFDQVLILNDGIVSHLPQQSARE